MASQSVDWKVGVMGGRFWREAVVHNVFRNPSRNLAEIVT
jgi:hypothetical protein